MKISPFIFSIAFIAAVICVFLGIRGCNKPESKEQTKPEVVRQKSEDANVKERIIYVTNDARLIAENNALKRALSEATSKDKQATTKAQHSASTFVNSGKLEDCRTALMDCQEENGTKAAVITVQGQQIGTLTEQRKADSSEINRLVLRSDTLNQGWKDANAALAKQKGKRWGLGIQAAYGMNQQGLSPYIGIGVQYTLIRW